MSQLSPNHSYIYLEVWVLLMVFSFWDSRFRISELQAKGFLLVTPILLVLWTLVDQLAVSLRLWEFPPQGNLPFRIFRLPVEEYVVFIIHSFLSFTLVEVLSDIDPRRGAQ